MPGAGVDRGSGGEGLLDKPVGDLELPLDDEILALGEEIRTLKEEARAGSVMAQVEIGARLARVGITPVLAGTAAEADVTARIADGRRAVGCLLRPLVQLVETYTFPT